jgi:hypothetical protein
MTKFHKRKLHKQIRRKLENSNRNNPNRNLAEYLYGQLPPSIVMVLKDKLVKC